MLLSIITALLCVLLVASIFACVGASLYALRCSYRIYDHLPDVNRLVARTSILAAVVFARMTGEGQRLRKGYLVSMAVSFGAGLLSLISLIGLLAVGPFR